MKKIVILSISFILVIGTQITFGQEKDTKKEESKSGITFGALPVVGYNSDLGFQYGILSNIFDFGDGSLYPEYKHSLYLEYSQTTKGGGISQIFFDSKHLLPKNIRITADISYLTEKALNFYGFNGFQSNYNTLFEDDQSDRYFSRMFYRHERKLFRATVDFQGKVGKKLRWLFGLGHYKISTASVDIENLNEGKDEENLLPDTALLYDKYVKWGIIGEKEKDGGNVNFLKFGFVFDTRDNEPNPMHGIWSEALIFTTPAFMGNKDFSYTKLALIHRQYFTLIKRDLSIACQLGYQGTIAGKAPFYIQPFLFSSFSISTTFDGFGGTKSLRGVLRNRIVGDGIVYGNIEPRWKFLHTKLFKQNLYLALSGFFDFGKIVKEYDFNKGNIPEEELVKYFDFGKSSLHFSYGLGFHAAMNQNFILAVDYGIASDKRDGKDGLYVGMGFLF